MFITGYGTECVYTTEAVQGCGHLSPQARQGEGRHRHD